MSFGDSGERAHYPVFFQGMAALEKKAIELLSYVHVRDSKAVTGPVVRVSREAWAGFVWSASPARGADSRTYAPLAS